MTPEPVLVFYIGSEILEPNAAESLRRAQAKTQKFHSRSKEPVPVRHTC